MRTFQQGIILLLISLSVRFVSAQSPATRLDSLKRVADSDLPTATKVNALNQIATYYARIPQPDSTIRYCDMAVKMAAADSFQQFMLHISTNEVMGTLNGVSSNYQESLTRYQEAYQSMQEVIAYPLTPREAVAVHQQLVRIENYMGIIHHKLGRYRQADSIFNNVIRSAQGIPDTTIWVNSLLSRRALYQHLSRFSPQDSTAARARFKTLRDADSDAGLALVRTYLKHHPGDFQMQRFLVYLLSNKAASMVGDPAYSEQQKKEMMVMLMEALRLARESGISGRDLLAAKVNFILLLRDLKNYKKAIDMSREVINEAHSLKLPVIESIGYKRLAGVMWRQKNYEKALEHYRQGLDLDISVNDYTEATILCEELAIRLSRLPLGKRLHHRQDAAYFRKMGAFYRQKATDAGQQIPAEGRLD